MAIPVVDPLYKSADPLYKKPPATAATKPAAVASSYLGKSFTGGGDLNALKSSYGLTDAQIRALQTPNAAGTATPTQRLGTSGYMLTRGAGGKGYTVVRAPALRTAGTMPLPTGAGSTPLPTPGKAPVPGAAPLPAPTSVQEAGAAAQTYSQTPGAAPTAATTNQGTQDVVRNQWLQQALQSEDVNANTPAVRQQADVFAAAQERARRDAVADTAERMGTAGGVVGGASGAQTAEERLVNERAAQSRAGFESELVGRELQNTRDEIQGALTNLGDLMTKDQERALTERLAKIDAQLKQAGITSSERLGLRELSLRDKLGMAGLNLDMQRMLMQNNQFNKDLGYRIGDSEAGYNQRALLALLGQG
jgi:hypothetical protein